MPALAMGIRWPIVVCTHSFLLRASVLALCAPAYGAHLAPLFVVRHTHRGSVNRSAVAPNENSLAYSMSSSDQGMWNSYAAISAYWSDTTAMDNLRGADITATTVAGSTETIGANTAANNVRGGHTVHTTSTSSFNV